MDTPMEALHILLIEDDEAVASAVQRLLWALGAKCDHAGTGEEGLALARERSYGVIVLDVELPDIRGFEVVQRLRSSGDHTPIQMLTGRADEEDVIHGLGAGADGYLTKPFSPQTLVAHLLALQRRGEMASSSALRFGEVEMDLVAREVRRGGRPIRLTHLEFKLLAALVRRAGEVASNAELRREVWGLDFDPGTGLVKVHVSHLRRKLEEGGAARVVGNVPGQGYRMVEPQMLDAG